MKRLASLVFLLPALAFAHAPEPKVVSRIALNLRDNGSNPDIVTTNLTYLFVPASPASLLYDPDGNLTNDGHFTYVWNSENQLTSVASLTNTPANSKRKLTFEYDALGRRIRAGVSRWTNSTWLVTSSNKFVYDGWNLVAELNATNNAVVRTCFRHPAGRFFEPLESVLPARCAAARCVGGLLWVNDASTLGSNSTHLVTFDGNGNVTALVDGPGRLLRIDPREDFLRQQLVGRGAGAEFVVINDRLAKAGRFGEARTAGDHGFKDAVTQLTTHFLDHFL